MRYILIRGKLFGLNPFNAKDPLYKAIESGVWYVNVYPVCEAFPCSREEFKGAWEDRFSFDYVNNQYFKSKGAGKLDSFNQELMLRITSPEERLINDSDIIWYKRSNVLQNKGAYNFILLLILLLVTRNTLILVSLTYGHITTMEIGFGWMGSVNGH